MSEWQPIDTAPKDGEDFLAYVLFDDGSGWHKIARWSEPLERFTYGEPFEEDSPVTHWMPLPIPPLKTSKQT